MATFTCATPLSTAAPPFVPRRASPFDPSTSSCRQDSEGGSSSGVGGMKTQELGSDEGVDSSSSGVAPPTQSESEPQSLPQPPILPQQQPGFYPAPPCGLGTNSYLTKGAFLGMNAAPQPFILPSLPPWVHPIPPGMSNDLFVHIQIGEVLNIVIGNELKGVCGGPATLRLVGECAVAPAALPLQVPPGHQVHQIVDEQGILRHLILSKENTNPFKQNSTPNSSGLMSVPPQQHSNFYTVNTVNRKWSLMHNGKPAIFVESPQESPEGEMDQDELERLTDMLNRIQSPRVVQVFGTDADIAWDAIDTSEAAAPGGPFPQIDASEFTYNVVLFEGQGRFISTYPCHSEQGNELRLTQLRPNTDYCVQLKVSLEERGIVGEPTSPVSFKTKSHKPEAPIMPKIMGKGQTWAHVTWRPALDNGCPVTSYVVYTYKVGANGNAKSEEKEKVWEGATCEARITNLKPATAYGIKITAKNELGESPDTLGIVLSTKPDGVPPKPNPPNAVIVNQKGIKIAWTSIPEFEYTVDQMEVATGKITTPKNRVIAGNVFMDNLLNDAEYRFRIKAHNEDGDSPYSDWLTVKMCGKAGEAPHPSERVLVPSRPYVVGRPQRVPEIGWKCKGAKDREFTYNLEGSTFTYPKMFRSLYKGVQAHFIVTDEEIQNIRVQSINKKGAGSEFSDVLVLHRPDEEITKPGKPDAPKLEEIDKGTLKAIWTPPKATVPTKSSLIFELRRLDLANQIVYSGPETSAMIAGLSNKQRVDIQVRGVIVTRNGNRYEGIWSATVSGNAPREQPKPPRNVRIALDLSQITWNAPESIPDLRFKVYCCEKSDGKVVEERVHETSECRQSLSKLDHAKTYVCRVIAFHSSGESEASEEISFTTPAGVPAQPGNLTVEADGTKALFVRWNAPDCRGDPIQKYRVKVESRGDIVRELTTGLKSAHCEYRIHDLLPDTPYRIEVSAQNGVGCGVSAAVSGRTKCPPPGPPRIDAEGDATMLKLRWKPTTTRGLIYKLVRLTSNDNHETIYEGEQCGFKLKNLIENTEYRFQIRCTDRNTGTGPWSGIYVFSTSFAHPPVIKTAPTASPSGDDFSQLEWSAVIMKPNSQNAFYRLQAVDCSVESARWTTVYDGPMTSFNLRLADYPAAVQARVMCVRPRGDGGELPGTPSPVVYIENSSAKRKNSQPPTEQKSITERLRLRWENTSPEQLLVAACLVAFLFIFVFIVFGTDSGFRFAGDVKRP